MHDSKSFVKGALLLTLAGLISKVLSAGYRIPLQNVTGDIGFYIYQQVYPILGMASVLALYGFPAAVSKLAAERKMAGKQMSFTAFLLPVMIILLAIGLAIFGLLYTQADTLAEWIGDKRLIAGYRLAAFLFLLLPFSALLRGMFQANQQMKPTAYSQMAEQSVRVAIIIAAATWLARVGADPYMIASAAGVAAISGTIAAILLLLVCVYRNHLHSPLQPLPTSKAVDWRYYIRTIVIFGMIQAVTHMLLLVIQLADTFTLLPNLLDNGLSKLAAMQQKGIFDRGQPLIQFGSVLGSSFALALIPNIAKAHKKTERTEMVDAIKMALAFGFYLAAGATLGLILLFPEVNMLLYENTSGTHSLQILTASIVLSSLCITAASILQSLGYLKRTAVYMLLAFACKWAANHFFVPMWGIAGAAFATVLTLFLLTACTLWELHRRLAGFSFLRHIRWRAWLTAGIAMAAFILLCKWVLLSAVSLNRLELLFVLLPIIIFGALLYVWVLFRMQAFTAKELEILPFVSRFLPRK